MTNNEIAAASAILATIITSIVNFIRAWNKIDVNNTTIRTQLEELEKSLMACKIPKEGEIIREQYILPQKLRSPHRMWNLRGAFT